MKRQTGGSALLWAVCALLVLTVVVAGILSLSKRYAGTEADLVAEQQAAYYARSGIALTADALERQGDACAFLPAPGESLSAEFPFNGNICTVKIDRSVHDSLLSLEAVAMVGDCTKTIFGHLRREDAVWRFQGYTAS